MTWKLAMAILAALLLGCGQGSVEEKVVEEKAAEEGAAEENAAKPADAPEPPTAAPSDLSIGENLLPGATAYPAPLNEKFGEALAAKGLDYKPRTEHLRPDGSPLYTNRLILESSPYLLQHAHNPVNWYPWGDEAFEKARRENRPVILSVGYSTCHWCHVMEKESFEDEEIARFLNEKYVLIKVDREQRPDIDEVYMTAVNLMTGRGGWPMTVWLTPDRKPFFGGTYFPARDGDRGSRHGFLTVIRTVRDSYDERGSMVTESANKIVAAIQRASLPAPAESLPGIKEMHAGGAALESSYDRKNGGFGGAPKFPQPVMLEFLLRYHRRTGDSKILKMVEHTLERMAAGGVYDQIGGGFHRYSTDRAWQVPHFEKMLYDNGQLATIYLEGYLVTGRSDFAEVAKQILDYTIREMQSPEGGFYSATDADSEGEEGTFFIWKSAEIDEVLGPERGKFVRAYYGVTEQGNFEHANILHVSGSLEEAAKTAGISPEDAKVVLAASRKALYEKRKSRIPPLTDTKIIAAWNGLMLSALAKGALTFNNATYLAEARRTGDFLTSKMMKDGRLARIWNAGKTKAAGTLEDYAFVAAGLLDLYEATFDSDYLVAAKELSDTLEAHFRDRKDGGYFLTSDDGEDLIARQKPDRDGVLPSGNSVAVSNLLRLGEFTSDDAYWQRAEAAILGSAGIMKRSPRSATKMLSALDFKNDFPKEIVIVKPSPEADAGPLLEKIRTTYVPNKVLVVITEGDEAEALAKLIPLAKGKVALEGRPTAYVCEKQVCALPTTDPEVFEKQIARVRKFSETEGL